MHQLSQSACLLLTVVPEPSPEALGRRSVKEFSCSTVALLLLLRDTVRGCSAVSGQPAAARSCLETLLHTCAPPATASRILAQFAQGIELGLSSGDALVSCFLKLGNVQFARAIASAVDSALDQVLLAGTAQQARSPPYFSWSFV